MGLIHARTGGATFGYKNGREIGYYFVMQSMSVSEAKDKLSTLVESVESTHDAVVITRHGKPAAVLISPDDLDSLQETLAWLSDPHHAAEMAEAEGDIAEGRMLSLKEVRAQLAKR
jgi:prevent-host-death family protein